MAFPGICGYIPMCLLNLARWIPELPEERLTAYKFRLRRRRARKKKIKKRVKAKLAKKKGH